MSDRYGRRPILLLGLIGSTIACLFFGLSKSNVGVAKSMLGEIADSTNQSQAFSIFGFAWGIGMIVGPVLGGYLANPAQNFPDTFGHWPFFIEYPYFLPCLIAAIGSVVGFIVGYFFLEETRGRKSLASTVEDNKIDATNGDHDYYPGSYQQQEEQQQQNELIERQNYVNAPMKTTNTDINSEIVDVDGLERQPLMLPPNAIQAQQVKFANRRSMGTASNQYGSMSTLSHEAGSVSPTESPYRLGLHRLQTASARSTLSRRPTPARPGLFRELTSASGTGSGMSIPVSSVFTTSYSERPLSSGVVGGPRQSLYAYSRPMSSGGLFSMADPSSLGLRGADGAGEIEIPADATLLTFGGYTNDPYLDSRGVVGGPDAFMESGRVSRMSYAPSQVFLLPPDPNNKDPNQPIQVLVVQQAPPVEGLSPMSITTIVAYAMLALHSIVFEEVYTLYAVTPMVSHGLGWNATQLATSLASMGLVQLILQFVVYPRLERRFSAVLLFRVSQLLYCCVYLAFPMIRQFAVDELDMEHGGQIARVRYMVLAGLVFKYVCSVFSYTSVMVMITNSAPAHLLGTVNGIGQTSASFMRAFGPALGGILWAWSLSNKLEFPFNYFFVFFLMGTIALLGFVHSFSIPKELARKRM
ncbi:hypothetical protein BGZ83_011106 [Gryganskiella cystojenkinii]|nr:hypothetical protein BGZ83_011106 [Gryganskiella cystojenkinii]